MGDAIEAREYPAIFKGIELDGFVGGRVLLEISQGPDSGFLRAIDIHEDKARGVPDLIREGSVAFRTARVEGDVCAGGSHGGQSKTCSIRAVLLNDLNGIEHVALGLGHLLAIGVADERV